MQQMPSESTKPNLGQLLANNFAVLDSGKRTEYKSGMVRDTSEHKVDYEKMLTGPMYHRYCEHLTKAEVKYPDIAPGIPNFSLATGVDEYVGAKKSLGRHYYKLNKGWKDEDHAAAIWFNVQVMEMAREALDKIDPAICINIDAQKVYTSPAMEPTNAIV